MSDFSALEGKSIGIAAPIGGGKTTCIDAMQKILKETGFNVLSEPEYVPPTLLKLFYTDPVQYGQDFQTHMHAHASIRDKNATQFVKNKSNRVSLVERPLAENFVFFEANVKTGSINGKYRSTYDALWEDYKQYSPDLIIYLHVSNEHAIQRIQQRAAIDTERDCEKSGIDVGYMDLLGHEYFEFIKRHYNDSTRCPVMVFDWNTHVDVTDTELYHIEVKKLLSRVNSYFNGSYKLPNFTVSSNNMLATSTSELQFHTLEQKYELLSALSQSQHISFTEISD